MGIGNASKTPVVWTNEGGSGVVAVFQIGRKLRKIWIVWPGFQEQHRARTILRQAGSQYISCRPGPNYNDVIAHRISSPAHLRTQEHMSHPSSQAISRVQRTRTA